MKIHSEEWITSVQTLRTLRHSLLFVVCHAETDSFKHKCKTELEKVSRKLYDLTGTDAYKL